MSELLIDYSGTDTGRDGYPHAWHRCPRCEGDGAACIDCLGAGSAKELVRQMAGHRCVRCGHAYRPGCGTWSAGELGSDVIASEDGELAEPAGLFSWPEEKVNPPPEVPNPVLWSPCDALCTHGHGPAAPVRWRGAEHRPWSLLSPDYRGTIADVIRSGSEAQAAWRILTVHHLDEVKTNCRWWNLMSACQRCHLDIQRRVKMDRAYPWPHSEWFQPYVAGFYAWKYRGEDLTRPEVEARLPELLAMGQQEEAVERMEL